MREKDIKDKTITFRFKPGSLTYGEYKKHSDHKFLTDRADEKTVTVKKKGE